MRADLNLIDLDGMHLRAPEMAFDLPAGGRRLVQRADGYVATLVAGEVTDRARRAHRRSSWATRPLLNEMGAHRSRG